MDIPVFHLDFLNNRVLIAIIAILHVVINHGMAVGGIPLIAFLEHKGLRSGNAEWDRLARRILTSFFIITTTVGALTGVGIWFSAALVNPYAIGSLLRVFFWTWFVEWLVFVTEVVLILIYNLTWEKWAREGRKAQHIKLGYQLAFASWATMALIVSILGFMMDPGSWHSDRSLFSGMLNPAYLPQLAFRTPVAMVMAGAYAWVTLLWNTERGSEFRERAVQAIGTWILFWSVPCLLGGYWYAKVVPEAMLGNLPVAIMTQALEGWSKTALEVLGFAGGAILLLALRSRLFPASVRPWMLVAPAVLSILMLGMFERVREFVRKPYAIAGYLYSNGFRPDDYPILQRDGILAHATYTSVREVNPENEVEAGREVFNLSCTRCHTVNGVNGIRDVLSTMYGEQPWKTDVIAQYIGMMHNARPFMPPFPGSERERQALASYLVHLQERPESIEGAQHTGVAAAPRPERRNDGTLVHSNDPTRTLSRGN